MKSKVFIVIPTLGKGGAERVVSTLSNTLSEYGYQVSLVILTEAEEAYFINNGIELIYLTKGRRSQNIINRLRHGISTFKNFYLLLKKKKPDYLISFTTTANIWSAVICNLTKTSYIVSERANPDKTVNAFPGISKKAIFWLYQNALAVVVPSEGMVQRLKQSRYFKELNNLKVIRNPVSFSKSTSQQSVHPRRYILAVGRLVKVKGFDRLIEAFSLLNEPDVDLIILGEGQERDVLSKQIDLLGMRNRVLLPGAKDKVQDYYKNCEVFLLTSLREGYPNVLIEAMASGCACIAFDCNYGPREIIEHGKNGLLIPNGDIQLMAQAIKLLLEDPDLRFSLGENAKSVRESNSAKEITSKWKNLMSEYT